MKIMPNEHEYFLKNVCIRYLDSIDIPATDKHIAFLKRLIKKEPSYKEKILPILDEPVPENCKNRLLYRIKQHNKAEELCKKLIEIIDRKISAEEDFDDLC